MSHQVDVLLSLSPEFESMDDKKLVNDAKESLHEFFSGYGKLRNTVVCRRADTKHLVAIVRFAKPEHADLLLNSFPFSVVPALQGLTIESLKFSEVFDF